jgi:hypothetical protein
MVAAVLFALPSRGDERDFGFSLGYAHLFWDGTNTDVLEEQGGLRFDGRFTWPVGTPADSSAPHLRLGLGVAIEGFISEQGGEIEDDDDDDGFIFITPDDWNQLSIIEPELQLSVRGALGPDWYLEPGFGASAIVGNYVRGEEVFGFVDEDIDRWRLGAAGRLFVRLAWRRGRSAWGIEGSYSYGWIDFGDDIGGDIQRGHLTFFYARSF